MRVFTAIDCNKHSDYFSSLQQELPSNQSHIIDSYHILLHYLGDISKQHVHQISRDLKEIKTAPFSLKVDHLGTFSQPKGRQIIWAGVKEESKLMKLQHQLQLVLQEHTDSKKTIPRVTLARVPKVLGSKKASRKAIEPLSINVNHVKLIASELTPHGPVYTELAHFEF